MEATVNTNYINIATLMHEIDIFKTWVPTVTDGGIIRKVTPNREIGYLKYNPPWPIAARESIMEGTGFIWKKENAILFLIRTFHDETWFGTRKSDLRDHSRMEFLMNKAFVYIKPLGPNKTLFKYIMNADPQMDFIPPFLMNLMQSTVSSVFLSYIANMGDTVPAVYT